MKDTIKNLWKYLRKYTFQIFISLIISIAIVILTLYIPVIVANAIDYIVDVGNVNFEIIKTLCIEIAIFTFIIAILQWLMNTLNNKITFYVACDLRNDILKKLHNVPLKYIDSNKHGDILSRAISDVENVSDGLLMGFTDIFSGILTIIITIFFMFSINSVMTLLIICLTPISLFLTKYISKRTYIFFKEQSSMRGIETSYLNEMISNQRTVIAFGKENENIEKFKKINDKLGKVSLKAVFFSSLVNPGTRFINNIIYASVMLTGALIAIAGKITIGSLSCFLSYAAQYAKPFNTISIVITELQNAFACADRIIRLLNEEEQKIENDKILSNAEGNINIKNISFGYDDKKPLIENMNISANKGQKIAIVGPTGCGKTTLINLLMRFYEINNGDIFIDGINIKDVTRNSLRNSFGMVLQDTWIKRGTILENIRIGRADASDIEVKEAAKAAMAYNFIMRLPDGFDTIVDDNDGILSEGERQLISIARVLLKNPPMLILDEATSNIDTRTEEKINLAFDTLMKNRTSFIVAHRLSTIISADKILVMKDGKIIEEGNHNELINLNGFYTNLYNSQFEKSV